MKKNDIKIETLEDVMKSISTTGKAINIGSVSDRASERFEQKEKEQEQDTLNSQQENVVQEKWEFARKHIYMKEDSLEKIIFTALVEKIEYLEKRIRDLELSDSIHNMRLR